MRSTSYKRIEIEFKHGLGDCVYFAHQLPLYTKRGYSFDIHCHPRKAFVFRDCENVSVIRKPKLPRHGWLRGPGLSQIESDFFFLANKSACNISRPPMPNIGLLERELWDEYASVKLDLSPHIESDDRQPIDRKLRRIAGPIILIHSHGNSLKGAKNIDDENLSRLCNLILQKTDATIILLDWDRQVTPRVHPRIKHMFDLFGSLGVPQLLALYERADLLIGIDSGPAHLARFTNLPTMFIWYRHHPAVFTLPRNENIHLVPRKTFHRYNLVHRHQFNIVECSGERVGARCMIEQITRFFEGERYLKGQVGADLQMQQFVRNWIASGKTPLSTNVDRDKSFEIMMSHLLSRPRNFVMIETGTIRVSEDWRGAGYSTYLFGMLAHRNGGKVYSVDIEPARCQFSILKTRVFGDCVEVINQDSLKFLAEYQGNADLIYLDSIAAETHGLEEAKLATRLVAKDGLIAFDDTIQQSGKFVGKGALGVPWLLENGFELIFSGYQMVLKKK